ncbi:MAG TPA: hypothetical protein PLO43_03685, partial [Chlamydiales bacterium]|nr:hypothetical protein [Chlamydiales bacterium]
VLASLLDKGMDTNSMNKNWAVVVWRVSVCRDEVICKKVLLALVNSIKDKTTITSICNLLGWKQRGDLLIYLVEEKAPIFELQTTFTDALGRQIINNYSLFQLAAFYGLEDLSKYLVRSNASSLIKINGTASVLDGDNLLFSGPVNPIELAYLMHRIPFLSRKEIAFIFYSGGVDISEDKLEAMGWQHFIREKDRSVLEIGLDEKLTFELIAIGYKRAILDCRMDRGGGSTLRRGVVLAAKNSLQVKLSRQLLGIDEKVALTDAMIDSAYQTRASKATGKTLEDLEKAKDILKKITHKEKKLDEARLCLGLPLGVPLIAENISASRDAQVNNARLVSEFKSLELKTEAEKAAEEKRLETEIRSYEEACHALLTEYD